MLRTVFGLFFKTSSCKYKELNHLDKFYFQDVLLPIISILKQYGFSLPLIKEAINNNRDPFTNSLENNILWFKKQSNSSLNIFEITSIKVIPDPGREINCQTISIKFEVNGQKYTLSSIRNKYSLANARKYNLKRDDLVKLILNNRGGEEIDTMIFPEYSLLLIPTHSDLIDKLSEYGIG